MGRVGAIMGGLDRRGWNAGAADGLWAAVRSEWVCLKGGLEPLVTDLQRRAVLADILNGWSGAPNSDPFAPFGPGMVPLFLPVDLGAFPWLTPAERAQLERQGLAALDQLPVGSLGDDPLPPNGQSVGGGGGGGGGGSWGDEDDGDGGDDNPYYQGAGIALGATGVLAADDATGVGVVDDVAIPVTLVAAGALALGGLIHHAVSSDGDDSEPAPEPEPTVGDIIGENGENIGRPGRSPGVREVDTPEEVQEIYDRLSEGGEPIEGSSYPGDVVQQPDGTRVGIRPDSRSGGPTVDIRLPGGQVIKVHLP
jgi:hypothetical protein